MRNRSPPGGGGGGGAKSIRSPIQGGYKDKPASGGALLKSKCVCAVAVLALVGFVLFVTGSVDSIVGAAANKENMVRNMLQKNRKDQVVRDADGDIVEDDTLKKDILAGHVIERKHLEDAETDIDDGQNRWDKSNNIPQWLKDYFAWHNEVTAKITEDNWREHNYLVMTCLGGQVCGNVAHRLRPIMGMLRVAADTNRIFMMHWDLPDRLEEYLHPPQHGGLHWLVPQFIMWKVRKSHSVNVISTIVQQAKQDDRRIVNCMYNDDSFAEPYYNDNLKEGEVAASKAFKDVWDVLFKPSFMLTERVKETFDLIGLKPGEYATAHIDYEAVPQDDNEQQALRLKVEEAMNCMSQLRPGGPFLVAAQTYAVAREALAYGKQHNVVVHAKQIAHDSSKVPVDLYLSFVEIMLMMNSRCVAFHRGGYGQLGYMLGYDYNCRIKYGGPEECTWKDPPPPTQEEEVQHKEEHHDEDHHDEDRDEGDHEDEPVAEK